MSDCDVEAITRDTDDQQAAQADQSPLTEDLKKLVNEGKEIEFYFIINECGGFIWRMNHEMYHDRISLPVDPVERGKSLKGIAKDIENMRIIQKYFIDNLPKIGLEKPLNDDATPTEEYWKWFRWWDRYIKNLSDETWYKLNLKMKNKEDISSYRPEGDWRTT